MPRWDVGWTSRSNKIIVKAFSQGLPDSSKPTRQAKADQGKDNDDCFSHLGTPFNTKPVAFSSVWPSPSGSIWRTIEAPTRQDQSTDPNTYLLCCVVYPPSNSSAWHWQPSLNRSTTTSPPRQPAGRSTPLGGQPPSTHLFVVWQTYFTAKYTLRSSPPNHPFTAMHTVTPPPSFFSRLNAR